MSQATIKVESSPSFWQSVLEMLAGFFLILSLAAAAYGVYEMIQAKSLQSYFYLAAGLAGVLISVFCLVVAELGADTKGLREELEDLADAGELEK
ncbi:MAG: hypothetical protein V3U65_17595 [Granulosicoccaceae bacterium]